MEDVIKLKLVNHAMLQLVECEASIVQEIYDYFSFHVPGYKFMPAYKNKFWDGQIHMLNKMNGEINAGLFWQLERFAKARKYTIEIEESKVGSPYDKNKISHMENMKFIESLELPHKVRDYQYDAFIHAVENKRGILISPTGSGKSLIIYLLMRWYLKNHHKKVLIVVPTTSLVEQMYKDFADYNYDAEANVHRIYSGKDKNTKCRVIVSTWQSISKLPPAWFEQFGAVIGDECHGFKAKSLSSIMNKCLTAPYRFGTTGTLDGTQCHQMVLEGLFGPIKQVTTTKELQEKDTLSAIDITVLVLKYAEQIRQEMTGATYQQEIDFIVSNRRRNKLIANLANDLQGNTLVLFNLVDKHGKPLRDLIKEKVHEKRKVFFVSGGTKTEDREAIRSIVEKETDAIIVASLGTFSTGINIRNLHNIIFASPSKSQIRVLQSIGRTLRKSDDGSTAKLFDIADDLSWGKRKNFTLLHSFERVKIYKKEEFPFKFIELDIT